MKGLCVQPSLTCLHGCFGNDVGVPECRMNGVISQQRKGALIRRTVVLLQRLKRRV